MPDDLLQQLAARRALARMPSTEAGIFTPQGASGPGAGDSQQAGGFPPLSAMPNPQAPPPAGMPNPMFVPPAAPAQGMQPPQQGGAGGPPGGPPPMGLPAQGGSQMGATPMGAPPMGMPPQGAGPQQGPPGRPVPPQGPQAPAGAPAPGGLADIRPPWQSAQMGDLYQNRNTNLAAGGQTGRELRPAPPTNPGSRGPGRMPGSSR